MSQMSDNTLPNDIDLITPKAAGFAERVTPKTATEEKGVFFFSCSGCKGVHFRHAGYVKAMVPFMRAGGEKRISVDNHQVMVCVKCRRSYVWINEQMYEVTEQIDLSAWEKFEREADRATGPGGEC